MGIRVGAGIQEENCQRQVEDLQQRWQECVTEQTEGDMVEHRFYEWTAEMAEAMEMMPGIPGMYCYSAASDVYDNEQEDYCVQVQAACYRSEDTADKRYYYFAHVSTVMWQWDGEPCGTDQRICIGKEHEFFIGWSSTEMEELTLPVKTELTENTLEGHLIFKLQKQ